MNSNEFQEIELCKECGVIFIVKKVDFKVPIIIAVLMLAEASIVSKIWKKLKKVER